VDAVEYGNDVIPSEAQQAANRGWGGLESAFNLGLLGANIGLNMLHSSLTNDSFSKAHPWVKKGKLNKGSYARYARDEIKSGQKAAQDASKMVGTKNYSHKKYRQAMRGAESRIMNPKQFARRAKLSFARKSAAPLVGRLAGLTNIMFMAPMLYGMAYHGFKGIQRLGYQLERPDFGGQMTLPTAAFTDRQRALQAMHNSEFNGRSAIGNEAGLYHR
jgi:hypothetical protein